MTELQVIELIISLLAATGALGVFIKFGARLAVQEDIGSKQEIRLSQLEKELKQIAHIEFQLGSFESRLVGIEKIVVELKVALVGLNKIDVILEKLLANSERLNALTEVMKSVMPRSEVELRFKAQDLELQTVKEEITKLYKDC